MYVAFTDLLPYVFFIVLVTTLSIARLSESREQRRRRHIESLVYVPPVILPERLAARRRPRFSAVTLTDAFEPDTAILWETQMPALQLMFSVGADGLDEEDLRPFYVRSAAAYPELYEGSSFEIWLRFLKEARLVTWQDGLVVITSVGEDFLKCYRAAEAVPSAHPGERTFK